MKSRIAEAFVRARAENRGALMPYLTAGDPNLDRTLELLQALARGGADLVELGIPYSDPLADGPVIQAAGQRALTAGTKVAGIAAMVGQLRAAGCELPIVLMTCYNPILAYGPEQFAADFAAAGADGVLVTDLPPAESEAWCALAAAHELATVFLVAPTTPPERVHLATERTTGFVYAVSRAGVTGVRESLPADLADLVAGIRAATDLPVAVGFGISTADHVRQVCRIADGAVVGSALVKVIAEHGDSATLVPAVEEFVRGLREETGR
jgi:tryptophan synthase alpha chain